jgi:hypothetical protein
MKKLVVLSLFCLLAYAVTAGCVATVSAPAPYVAVSAPAPYVAAGPAPVAEVAVEPPPAITVQEPEMVVVPSGNEYVYMTPAVAGVYFYGGGWYRYYNGGWFSATVWGGPWVGIAVAPPVVVAIDPLYALYLPVGYLRIGWGDFHSHWRGWGHSHHWHGQSWYKHEMRRDVRANRMSHIRADRAKGLHKNTLGHKSFSKTGPSKFNKTGTSKFNKTGTTKFNKTGTKTMQKSGGTKTLHKTTTK